MTATKSFSKRCSLPSPSFQIMCIKYSEHRLCHIPGSLGSGSDCAIVEKIVLISLYIERLPLHVKDTCTSHGGVTIR